jgi:hypothetical protein
MTSPTRAGSERRFSRGTPALIEHLFRARSARENDEAVLLLVPDGSRPAEELDPGRQA